MSLATSLATSLWTPLLLAITLALVPDDLVPDDLIPMTTTSTGSQGLEGAVAAYRAGRYDEAWTRFAALAEAEPDARRRGVLHANAGTAAARASHLGHAIWHLEGARRLLPRDAAVATNLALVRARLGQGAPEAGQFAESFWRLPLQLTTRESRLAVAGLVSLGLLLLAWRRSGSRVAPPRALVVVVLLLAVATWAFDRAARARDLARAVVLENAVAMRAEPDRTGSINYRAGAGTIVAAEDARDGWSLIETREGARGWVPQDAVRDAAE